MILYLTLHTILIEGTTGLSSSLIGNSLILGLVSKIRALSSSHRELCEGVLIAYLLKRGEGIIFHRRLESIYIRDCVNSLRIYVNFSHLLENTLMGNVIEDTRRIEGSMCDESVLWSYQLLRPFEGAKCRVSFAAVPMPKQMAIHQILQEHGFLGCQQTMLGIKSFLLFITSDKVDVVRLNIAILHYKMNGDHKRICYGEILIPLNDHSLELVVFTRKICCDQ